MFSVFRGWLSLLILVGLSQTAQAQWQTQSISLKTGWNGVFLHVAPQTNAISDVLNSFADIQEIWLWKPKLSSSQFVSNPDEPTDTSSRWSSWKRSENATSALQQLPGNAGFLVRCSADVTWTVKGKPVPPSYLWSSTGLNFIGLPSVANSPPTFDTFLQKAPGGVSAFKVYEYDGATDPVPSRVFAMASTSVARGQAFWFEADVFNRYFSPISLVLPDNIKGIEFGDYIGRHRVIVRNHTADSINVSMKLLASESVPAGAPAIVGTPPVIIRGTLDTQTLKWSSTNLLSQPSSTMTFQLGAAGTDTASRELVLGVSRYNMSGDAGDLFAGILRFTDSLGHSQFDIPVSAVKESLKGLWVGDAIVTEVKHNLFQRPVADSGE